MQAKYNKYLIPNARRLRKEMTKEERHLWYDYLRNCPFKFCRQKVLGRYIADFYCAELKLVLELDGAQHYMDDGPEKDEQRTEYIEGYGITVLRIQNIDVNRNFPGVCLMIENTCREVANQ